MTLQKIKSIWNLINSLFYEENFQKIIKTVKGNVKIQNVISVYDYPNLGLVKDEDIVFSINDQQFNISLLQI